MPSSNDSTPYQDHTVQRRTALALLGFSGVAFTSSTIAVAAPSDNADSANQRTGRTFQNIAEMRACQDLEVESFVCTLGYYEPGDGGSALYKVEHSLGNRSANGGDVVALRDKKQAMLLPDGPVNYHMFGVQGDGKNDDGKQIKLAHVFANKHRLPIIHRSGEYWIGKTNSIPISTNVEWGNTIFHINEKFNEKAKQRFVVQSSKTAQRIKLDDAQKLSLLKNLRPGVTVLPELAEFKNCLVTIVDANDQIGFRAGAKYKGQSWDREELFYVEEEGRIVGDIAWHFNDYTTLTAYPCDDSYLTIDGGGFLLSGDMPGDTYDGYYSNGIRIERSRTVIRNQWMGLEPGNRDISMQPRSGFYNFSRVFDSTLENIRLIPWEQNRADPKRRVAAGTYGISGARMLNCTFRNLTAEGTWLHWGVFGTNLNKNFRIENCRLNRVDVHFHCWNLTIQDSVIGLRGISVTGGGTLTIENTVEHGNSLVNLRRDFGAKWDGDIRIRNCRLVPTRDRPVTVLYCNPSPVDYGYPIGCARTLTIENLVIDFSYFPESNSPVWLLNLPSLTSPKEENNTFFPTLISARNITVHGRNQGIRLASIPDPYHYQLTKEGRYDGDQLLANCQMIFENIDLEQIAESEPNSSASVHLRLGKTATAKYPEGRGIYPHIRITNCSGVCIYLGGSAANLSVTESTVDRLTAAIDGPLKGSLMLTQCRFLPRVKKGSSPIYALDAELGTHLTNCTLHAPLVDGSSAPTAFDRVGFVRVNRTVRYHQLNTALSNNMLKFLQKQKQPLKPAFIAMLKSHHALEPEKITS
ncbi:hypothetical protein [Bremerella alba]|uniref:Right handed beta helix domain-containing protein n=1 Tax=Bremerella alba TaxID=980252 RepID=A0A7V8VAL1_9BACT|nr:hypothetical protein [Bremerella alba]MBA2118024.1 hypothetical protein [Bremerella alba]